VWGYSIESKLIEFGDISPFEEVVIYCGGVEVVSYSVDEDKLTSESSVLDLFEEGIIESGYVSS
jgi:hypothetical protein